MTALAASSCEMVPFKIVREEKANNRTTTLDFRRADFSLLRELVGGDPIGGWSEGEGPRGAGWSSRTISSTPFLSLFHSDVQEVRQMPVSRECKQIVWKVKRRMSRLSGRNTETLPGHAGNELERPKFSWSWDVWWMLIAIKGSSTVHWQWKED